MTSFWRLLLVMIPLVGLVALPPLGQRLVTLIGIYALLGLGYQVVFGQLRAFNLAQGTLFGVGAYAAALSAPYIGGQAFLASILAAMVVAAFAAAPILRLQSHYFALATLALASLINLVAVHAESLTGGANGLVGFADALPRGPILMVLVWVCLIPSVLAYAAFFKGAMGENARLLREAPLEAATLGIDGGLWRFLAFVAGGAYAGLAGGFSAALSGVVSPDVTGFPVMLLCLTSVVVGGVRHPMGAVLGAAVAVCLPEVFRGLQGSWLLAYAAATLVVVLWAPDGLAGLLDMPPPRLPPLMPGRIAPLPGPQRLVLDRITKRFGGVEALTDVSFKIERGEIVGLIGPNGSGKTTLLNTISGLERADSGFIMLDVTQIERLPPHRIARAGIGRTFQAPIEGETRSDGLARMLASDAVFLLLDEPAAGMTEREREELVRLLGRLRDAGRGVILVDHDIELMTRVCDRLVCLDGGAVVAHGPPAEVRADPRVRASFLGLPANAA
jgi:branched-chain amino acid transport system permease protein